MEKTLSNDIEKNMDYINETLKDSDDLVIRYLELGDIVSVKVNLIYMDGLIDKGFLSEYAVGFLTEEEDLKLFTSEEDKYDAYNIIKDEVLATSEIQEEDNWHEIIKFILSGDTAVLVENSAQAIIIGTRGAEYRGIDEPQTEAVIRGPREGFTEVGKFNISLIRRRLRDPSLKVKMHSVGRRTQNDVAVMYIDGIVDKKLLAEVNKRLDNIDIDGVFDSSTLEHLMADNYLSPFPQAENTERPDTVAAAILEGRVAIIMDNTPFALIVPATIGTLYQSAEDYYTEWTEASLVRLLRILCGFLVLLSTPLYIAITAYHPGIMPTKMIYYLSAGRINVPFPSVVEALLMETTMEILRESGTRISGPIGNTIGIVGGLIIGEAAVEAGIVSPLMIIVIAISTIASFALPSYDFSATLRIMRILFIGLAAVLGLYGIMIGVILLGTHLVSLNSFGIPYTSPYTGLGIEEGDLKDTLVKAPVQRLWLRPGFTFPKNKKRMGRGDKDDKGS
ncbi:MAG TPA: spore germination protein [Tissierellaceae bacterium]|nr:spore germination protein [Tissierellaceae bacterium]